MLIVDALRLDMISSKDVNNNRNFQYMNDLLVHNSSQVHLFGFQADPPTTTSQRLKGLTTGSLPTFLDMSQNFNSKSVKEDNIIDQFVDAKKRLVVLGDDTWNSLYPDQFHIRYPFDSFNTRDIHTVDDGIDRYMWDLLHEGNWDVFIAHFLGVDHIGHSYSSSHPYMSQRLQRMDAVLKKTIDSMDDDTLLLLFGDHGMTNEGNHGGASYEELTSGLFVYSKQLSSNPNKSWDEKKGEFVHVDSHHLIKEPRIIRQIDLVPTLSLLMGISIPFSNMGRIIPELFDDGKLLLTAFFLNSIQVIKYFQEYFGNTIDRIIYDNDEKNEDDISLVQYCYNQKNDSISNCLITSSYNILHENVDVVSHKTFRLFDSLLANYQSFGRKKWTEFDELKILSGILLLLLLVGTTCNKVINKIMNSKQSQLKDLSIYTMIAIVFALIFSFSSISNSFIQQEKRLLFWFVQALNVMIFLDITVIQGTNVRLSVYLFHYLIPTVLCICFTRYAWSSHFNDANDIITTSYQVFFLWGILNTLLLLALVRDMKKWSMTMSSVIIFIMSQLMLLYYLHNDSLAMYWIPRTIFMLSTLGIITSIMMKTLFNENGENNILHVFMHFYSIAVLVLLTAKGKCNAMVLFSSLLFFGLSCEILRYYYKREIRKSSLSLTIIGWIIHMCLFGRLMFFLTSHQYDFSSLQLDTGFILSDSFNFYIAGMMLSLNTFISEIFGTVIILLLANYLQHLYYMHEIIILSITLFKLLTVFCSCLSAFILRRHLMVWAIFAPKVIFEISFWLVSSLILQVL